MNAMAQRGVATRRITACHLEPVYGNGPSATALPESEALAADHLLLPHFVGLTEQEQDEVVEALVTATR